MRAATRHRRHGEHHQTARFGWLRAAVLGANDGIVSTASLVLGVAAASGAHQTVLVAGVSGLVAGAMSMAAGEYVSVHSQADSENAELDRERQELKDDAEAELRELEGIYVKRGLDRALARQVAQQLTAHDALGAHARDELGITRQLRARPVQAAIASAASFATGAALPLIAVLLTPQGLSIPWVGASALATSSRILQGRSPRGPAARPWPRRSRARRSGARRRWRLPRAWAMLFGAAP